MNENKSDVEKFYNAVAAKFGVEKPFSALSPMEQIQLVLRHQFDLAGY